MIDNKIYGQVRLFISSTFHDMSNERDHLSNVVFPRLEEFCTNRNLTFMPIDLRWGITEEESKHGKVIEVCLEEIDNTRPFFVGLIGHRYGWMPDNEDLGSQCNVTFEKYPNLQSYLNDNLSITEIEMRYAVLDQIKKSNSVFFLRSDSVEVLPEFKEIQGSVAECKLKILKSHILERSDIQSYEYIQILEMGERLYSSVVAMIENEYGNSEIQEQDRHEFMLNKRADVDVIYDTVESNFNLWLKDKGAKLLYIKGEEGIGKSTVLCWLLVQFRKNYNTVNVHYFDLVLAIEKGNVVDNIIQYFANIVSDKSNNHIIALDNIDIIKKIDASRFIDWIKAISSNVRIIVSMRTDCYLFIIINQYVRNVSINIHGFVGPVPEEFFIGYFQRYGKKLSPEQLSYFVNAKFTKEPRAIALILKKMVEFGSFEQIDQEIVKYTTKAYSHYLLCMELEEEINNYFYKTFNDYFAIRIMSLLSFSLHGLSETEIIALSGCTQQQWALVRSKLLNILRINGNLYQFSSKDWANHVIVDVLTTNQRASFYKKMIKYFCEECNDIDRQSEELLHLHLYYCLISKEGTKEKIKLRFCVDLVFHMTRSQICEILYNCIENNIEITEIPEQTSLGKLHYFNSTEVSREKKQKYFRIMRECCLNLRLVESALYYDDLIEDEQFEKVTSHVETLIVTDENQKALDYLLSIEDSSFSLAEKYEIILLKCQIKLNLGYIQDAHDSCKFITGTEIPDDCDDKLSKSIVDLKLFYYEATLAYASNLSEEQIRSCTLVIRSYESRIDFFDKLYSHCKYVLWKYYMKLQEYENAWNSIIIGVNSAAFSYGKFTVEHCKMQHSLGRTQLHDLLNQEEYAVKNIMNTDKILCKLQPDHKDMIDALYELLQAPWSSTKKGYAYGFWLSHLERMEDFMIKNSYPDNKLMFVRKEKEKAQKLGWKYKCGKS